MQSAGGFIIDDLTSVFEIGPSDGDTATQAGRTGDVIQDDVATPKQLSAKQEAKLRSFLDASLDTLSRGYRKRFDPSSPLRTLTLYLTEWRRVISVLACVPPYGNGNTNLLVSYLLRCSTDLCDGIVGYGLAMEIQQQNSKRQQTSSESEQAATSSSSSEADEEEDRRQAIRLRNRQLNLVLQTLDLVDRIWTAILRGNFINLRIALAHSASTYNTNDDKVDSVASSTPGEVGSRTPFNAARLTTSLVASPALNQQHTAASRESLPIHGGRGHRTVGVTDQVRLRNIAITSREKLFAWMRNELDAPAPPTLDPEPLEEPPDNIFGGMYAKPQVQSVDLSLTNEGDSDDSANGNATDMEDVDIQTAEKDAEGYERQEDTAEHRHFQDLFDRKIDPDEDEDEDEAAASDEQVSDDDDNLGASVAGAVAAVRGEGDDSHKRKREGDESGTSIEANTAAQPTKRVHTDDVNTTSNGMAPSEMGSMDLNLSDGVGQWDLAFTRLFSKTLRTLSDLSEFSSRKTDSTSSTTPHTQIVANTDREDDDDD